MRSVFVGCVTFVAFFKSIIMKRILNQSTSIFVRSRHPLEPLQKCFSTSPKACQESTDGRPDSSAQKSLQDQVDYKDQKERSDTKLQSPAKTQLQLDEELRQKMSGLSGEGGESGVEYEDGQPVSMKRSVKQNMFRYI